MPRFDLGYHANLGASPDAPAYPVTIRRPQMCSADGLTWAGSVLSVDESGGGVVWLHRPGCAAVTVAAPLLYGFRATEPCVVVCADTGLPPTVTAVRASAVGDVVELDTVRHEIGVVGWDIRTVL